MAGRHKTPGDGPGWYTRGIENAGSSLFSNRSGLDGVVNQPDRYSARQSRHPTVMAFGQAGGGASASSSSLPAPQHVPHIPKPGFRFPKEGYYAAAAVGAAIVIYVAGWAAGVFPPSRTANGINVNPPPVSTSVQPYTPTPGPTATVAPTPTATPIPGLENILSEEQIRDYAIQISSMKSITPEALGKVVAINSSIYYLFTGKTFEQVDFIPKLLTHEEYKALEGKSYGTVPNSAGSMARQPNGETFLYVDIQSTDVNLPPNVLFTLFHETGNAEAHRRSLRNFELGIKNSDDFLKEVVEKYKLGDVSDLDVFLIARESLQALYRSVGFHKLEELGISFGRPTSKDKIEYTVNLIVNSENFFHQASIVAWSMALNRADTAESLRTTGRITSEQAYSLFDEAIKKTRTREGLEQRVAEVVTAVRNAPQYAQQIKDAAILSQRTSIIGSFSGVYSP